jgi:methylmalonyl-CoA mutase cobalamin-binding domain/chain
LSNRKILAEVSGAIGDFDIDKARQMTEKALGMKIPAYQIVMEGVSPGLRDVGERYERGDYFLSELLLASETAKSVLQILKPHFDTEKTQKAGKLLIGTVEGDMHDIGKNLVATLAEASGVEVHDLGVDISPKTFAQKTRELQPQVLGMSSLLSTTVPKFKETVEALGREALRDKVKVIIGGVSATQKVADEYGVDGYAVDAVAGAKKISEWLT